MGSKPSADRAAWQPTIPVDQSIYDGTQTTAKAPLGTRLEVGERVFYYAKLDATGTGTAGRVLCAPLVVSGMQDCAITTVAAGTGVLTITTAVSGDVIAANAYAEGYVSVNTGTAASGYCYRIRSHTSGSSGITLNLYDPTEVAMTAAAEEVDVVPSLYNGVAVAAAEGAGVAMGVTPCIATNAGYVWLQTWGVAAPVHQAANAANVPLTLNVTGGLSTFSLGGTTAGCVTATAMAIGKNFGIGATAAEHRACMITIRP